MFRLFEKLLALIVFGPPLYMVTRFIRWYAKQSHEEEAEA